MRKCNLSELQVADQLIHRVIAAWQKWWRLALALVRLVSSGSLGHLWDHIYVTSRTEVLPIESGSP